MLAPVQFPILHRRHLIFFFEYILEIRLARIAKIGADLGETPVIIGQKIAGLFQL